MKVSHIILSVLLIGGMVMGCLLFMNDLGDKYGAEVNDTGFDDVETKFYNVTQTATELKGNITSMILPETVTETLLVPYKMIKVGWQGITLILGSFGIMTSFLGSINNVLSSSLSLPDWTIILVETIIIVIVMIILIESFMRWKLES